MTGDKSEHLESNKKRNGISGRNVNLTGWPNEKSNRPRTNNTKTSQDIEEQTQTLTIFGPYYAFD